MIGELLARYAWMPGVCWRCEQVTQVTVTGEIVGADGTAFDLVACALCLVRMDQIHSACREREYRLRTPPTTADEVVAYYRPAIRDAVHEAALREWLNGLLDEMPEPDVARLVYGVRGTVHLPEAC